MMTKRQIQSFCSLKDSKLWSLQQEYYYKKGISVWADHQIPYFYSSSLRMATYYAELILSFYQSHQHLYHSQPLLIFELGAGSGKLAFHIVQLLSENIDNFTYIMSDMVAENVDFAMQHPKIQPLLKFFDFVQFDALANQELELKLKVSQKCMGVGQLEQPIVVLANYFFDCLPRNMYYVQYAQLYDVQVALYQDTISESITKNYNFKRIESCPEDDANARYLFDVYRQHFQGHFFMFPWSAIQALKHLKSLSQRGLFLISGDRGESTISDLKINKSMPFLKDYGGATMMKVNYHALLHYFTRQGATALISPANTSFLTHVCLLDLESIDSEALSIAFSNSPDSFYVQLPSFSQKISEFPIQQLLDFLVKSHYDSYVLQEMAPRLIQLLKSGSRSPELIQSLEEVSRRHYPIETPDRLNYTLGLLYYYSQYDELASPYFEKSMLEGFEVEKSTEYMKLCQRKIW